MALETKSVLNVNVEPAKQSLKSLRDEIKAAKEEMLNAEEGSKKYSDALQYAADKAFELREMQVKIRGTANDLGEMLANGTKVIGGLASGFTAAQGALGLFGIKSEDLEKTLVKVQSAIALMNGIQGLEGLGKNFSNLMTQLGKYQVVQKAVTAAQWLWNAAMSANPIGLLIAGVAALGTAIYGLTKYLESSEEATIKQNTATDGLIFATEGAKIAHEKHISVMQDLQIELDITTGKISDLEGAILRLELEYGEKTKKIKKDTEDNVEKSSGFWNNLWNSIKSGGNVIAGAAKTTTEIAKIYADGNQEQLDALEEFEKRKELLVEKENKKAREKRKKEDNQIKIEKTSHYTEITNIYSKELQAQMDLDAAFHEFTLDEERKANFESAEMRLERLQLAIQMKDEELAAERQLNEAKRSAVADGFQTIADITTLFASKSEKAQKRAFEVQKIANIAKTVIDTYTAAMGVFRDTPGGFIIRGLAAAATITAGLVNVKKIMNTKFESGASSASSTGSSTPSVATAPKIPQAIAPTRNVLTQSEKDLQSQPIKAYVVETDITQKQNKIRKLEEEASF